MQKLLKSIKIFQSYDYKCTATFVWFAVLLSIPVRTPACYSSLDTRQLWTFERILTIYVTSQWYHIIILWLTDLQMQLAADTSIWRPPPYFPSRQLSLKGVACRQVTWRSLYIVAK